MSYNLQTVRTRIQQKLDDDGFDTATIDQFINDGQRDILNSRRFTFMEKEATLTTTPDSSALTGLPDDFQVAISLRIVGDLPQVLNYVEYDDFDVMIPDPDNVAANFPKSWYVFNNSPYVYPRANDTYNIKLKYLKKPAELVNDGDIPEIPEEFSEALVIAGYKRALEFNDENDKAQLVQIQVDELIEKMDERYKRQIGVPHILKTPRKINTRRL